MILLFFPLFTGIRPGVWVSALFCTEFNSQHSRYRVSNFRFIYFISKCGIALQNILLCSHSLRPFLFPSSTSLCLRWQNRRRSDEQKWIFCETSELIWVPCAQGSGVPRLTECNRCFILRQFPVAVAIAADAILQWCFCWLHRSMVCACVHSTLLYLPKN